VKASEAIKKGVGFFSRQEKTFKVNLLRVSGQNFFLTLTQQYQSLYIVGLGATPFQLGVVNGIGGVAAATAAAPTGWLADKYGIRRILLFATSLLAVGTLIFALAPDWTLIIPAIFILTLALRMAMTVCPVVCGSCLRDEERATGMQICDTLSALPRLVSPLLAAFIVTEFGGIGVGGVRPLYYLQFLGLCLVFMLVLRWFTNPKRRRTKGNVSSFLDGLRQINAEGWTVRKWIVYLSLSTIPFSINTVYLPLFAAEVKLADQFILGGMGAASTLVPLLLSIPVGRLADTFGRKKMIYIMSPIYWSSILLLIYAPNPRMLIVSGVLQGFYMVTAVTQGAMTAELVPTDLLGRWYGILGFFRGLIMMLTPLFSGVIWSAIGPEYVFFFMILTELSKMTILVTMPETLRNRD
jgi:MFS family permease